MINNSFTFFKIVLIKSSPNCIRMFVRFILVIILLLTSYLILANMEHGFVAVSLKFFTLILILTDNPSPVLCRDSLTATSLMSYSTSGRRYGKL
jgi:hypothetical protein